MIQRTQIYTTTRWESSHRGEISRAADLVRQATHLLRGKATRLPHGSPGTRLQKIATHLSDFGDSLERAATVLESSRRGTSPNSSGEDLTGIVLLESKITGSLRRMPIGSRTARELYALRASARALLEEQRASAPLESRGEHIADVVDRVMTERAGGAA